MEATNELYNIFMETAERLTGWDRRAFMVSVVNLFGKGGQRKAERELGWNRGTIRRGMLEQSGPLCAQRRVEKRGRKPVERKLLNLLEDIEDIAEKYSQTDPKFKSSWMYTRLSAAEMRRQLIEQKGYTDEELPCVEIIRQRLNQLGYRPSRVRKTRPLKKIPETDAIFKQVHKENEVADADESVLRISTDAKATVKLGDLSRGGKSRVVVKGMDHDFQYDGTITPVTIYLPKHDEVYIYMITSKVTSDCIVDCIEDFWQNEGERFAQIETIVLNQDNGPENHSRRTQFMNRMVMFADKYQIIVKLAYYPPYHSKYNPSERVWGALENHWNGSLLNSIEAVVGHAQTMRWNDEHPTVKLVKTIYKTGVKLTEKGMAKLEKRFERLPNLEKWFVKIAPA
ncbi:MAG: ISAzo13 family transposase [Gammaproteobacteria bacterium]|nr:ISAzo13 family transposase [Gammaproteobacteria bacterium]